jgi:hypothetical protein
MSGMLPQHYALTEAVVAVIGAYAVTRAARISPRFLAGLLPFALAGFVGTIRIGIGMTGSIEHIHQLFSRPGAVFGLGCLVGALAAGNAWLPPLLGVAAAALAILVPGTVPSAFAALVLVGAAFAYRGNPDRAPLAATSFAVLLIGRLVTDPLRAACPALAWHSFHLAVATWLLLLVIFVLPSQQRVQACSR